MRSIYIDSSVPENETKKTYNFPEFIMMENAAVALENAVMSFNSDFDFNVIILCGSGNNGGDGYALARRIYGKVNDVVVYSFNEPKTTEAIIQKKMVQSLGVKIEDANFFEKQRIFLKSNKTVIVDCIYGTGFHGQFNEQVSEYISFFNNQNCFRLACDIPSGIDKNGNIESKDNNGKILAFSAHKTVTMGALKVALFSDKAKDFVGIIETADLGVAGSVFESGNVPDCYLIEEKDVKLPVREKKSAHKGNFGHTAIVLGEKQGAGIIAGTAALRIGTGLVSLVETENSSQQFMMNPELMIAKSFPEKTNAILLGSGFGRDFSGNAFSKITEYIFSMQMPAVVFDADFFYCERIADIIKKLNGNKNSKVILTPHPKEFVQLLKITMPDEKRIADSDEKSIIENRFEFACLFAKRFPNITLISKGANTIICSEKEIYIYDNGSVALAKAGSGDVLAGLCTGLLSQGYSQKDAAIAAVWLQGKASQQFAFNYECTPLTLIEKLKLSNSND